MKHNVTLASALAWDHKVQTTLCPCVMRQKGLEPTDPWTPEKIAELHEAFSKMFEWKVSSK